MSTWSSKDDQSTKSWGTIDSSPYVSPTVTWGTLPSSTSSSPCLQTVIDHDTTNNIVGSPQEWASNVSSPLYPSLSNPPSVAGSFGGMYFFFSPSAANWQVTRFCCLLIIPLGYSSPPASSSSGSWIQLQLNPLLDSRSPQCLNFDIGALPIIHNINGPAVHPPRTFLQLSIVVPPFKWSLNIQVHSGVTVFQVVQHLCEYLQAYHNPQDLQKSKVQIPSGHHSPSIIRDQNRPNGYHSGKRRIDLLGRRRRFRGLSPDPGSSSWVVHLLERWWYVYNALTWTFLYLKLTYITRAQHWHMTRYYANPL